MLEIKLIGKASSVAHIEILKTIAIHIADREPMMPGQGKITNPSDPLSPMVDPVEDLRLKTRVFSNDCVGDIMKPGPLGYDAFEVFDPEIFELEWFCIGP